MSDVKAASVYRSCSFDQSEILDAIEALHVPDGFDVDCTFGNGSFWKGRRQPKRCFDLQPLQPHVEEADSRRLPFAPGSVGSVMFDPPFLTYVRAERSGNGNMAMARRFSGYWSWDELADHYQETISEVSRVLRPKGVLVVKCQDIIHNHRLHVTHQHVIEWAAMEGLRLVDLFVLAAKHRMPSPNRQGAQRHARIFHCYFLVFRSEQHRRRADSIVRGAA